MLTEKYNPNRVQLALPSFNDTADVLEQLDQWSVLPIGSHNHIGRSGVYVGEIPHLKKQWQEFFESVLKGYAISEKFSNQGILTADPASLAICLLFNKTIYPNQSILEGLDNRRNFVQGTRRAFLALGNPNITTTVENIDSAQLIVARFAYPPYRMRAISP